MAILVPRGRAPFGQHQKSRPLARSNTGSPRFTNFPSLCACSELSLTNVIGSGLNLLCLQSHSKPECRWTWPEVVIFGADQKERGLWGREWLNGMLARLLVLRSSQRIFEDKRDCSQPIVKVVGKPCFVDYQSTGICILQQLLYRTK